MKVAVVVLIAISLCFASAELQDHPYTLTKGVLDKIYQPHIVNKLESCIRSNQTLAEHWNRAMTNINGTSTVLIQLGFKNVGKAIYELANSTQSCAGVSQLAPTMRYLANEFIAQYDMHIYPGQGITWKGKSVYEYVKQSSKMYNSTQYYQTGYIMGHMIRHVFPMTLDGALEDAQAFIEGFFEGTLGKQAYSVNKCIEQAIEIFQLFEKLVRLIMGGIIENVLEIIGSFGTILTKVPSAVKHCSKVPKAIAIYKTWASRLLDIEKMKARFYQAFIEYGVDITKETQNIVKAFPKKQYKPVGKSLGTIAYIVLEKCKFNPERDLLKE